MQPLPPAGSEPKAAELLGLSVHELNWRMEEPPDSEPETVARVVKRLQEK